MLASRAGARMRILALDTASPVPCSGTREARSAAPWRSGRFLRTPPRALPDELRALLADAGRTVSRSRIASPCCPGPGSFTGLRAGSRSRAGSRVRAAIPLVLGADIRCAPTRRPEPADADFVLDAGRGRRVRGAARGAIASGMRLPPRREAASVRGGRRRGRSVVDLGVDEPPLARGAGRADRRARPRPARIPSSRPAERRRGKAGPPGGIGNQVSALPEPLTLRDARHADLDGIASLEQLSFPVPWKRDYFEVEIGAPCASTASAPAEARSPVTSSAPTRGVRSTSTRSPSRRPFAGAGLASALMDEVFAFACRDRRRGDLPRGPHLEPAGPGLLRGPRVHRGRAASPYITWTERTRSSWSGIPGGRRRLDGPPVMKGHSRSVTDSHEEVSMHDSLTEEVKRELREPERGISALSCVITTTTRSGSPSSPRRLPLHGRGGRGEAAEEAEAAPEGPDGRDRARAPRARARRISRPPRPSSPVTSRDPAPRRSPRRLRAARPSSRSGTSSAGISRSMPPRRAPSTSPRGSSSSPAFLDSLDGRVARWTGTTSAFGEQLDSLADVVRFGVAPAFLVYRWGLRTSAARGSSSPSCSSSAGRAASPASTSRSTSSTRGGSSASRSRRQPARSAG